MKQYIQPNPEVLVQVRLLFSMKWKLISTRTEELVSFLFKMSRTALRNPLIVASN